MTDGSCELRFYDPDFNWLTAARSATSVQFGRDLYGIGAFEIHLPFSEGLDLENISGIGNVVIINGDSEKSGIINAFEISEDRNGGEVVLRGFTANGITADRIVVPPTNAQVAGSLGWDRISGDAETVIKHYAAASLTAPYNQNRVIPAFVIAANQHRGQTFPWQCRYTPLDAELANIGKYSGMGYKITPDLAAKQWVFEVIEGEDRTKTSDRPIVFDTRYQMLDNYRYSMDCSNARNAGYAGGQGENEKRLIYILGDENAGIARRETFLDCGNAANINELIYYATPKLAELQPVQNFEAAPNQKAFQFGRDYLLGDVVTIYIHRLKISIDLKVTAVKEIWEKKTGYKAEQVFGGKIPTILTILDKKGAVR